jgi:acyl carrier protein
MLTIEQVRDTIASAVPAVDASKLPVDVKFEDAGLDSLDHASILLELQERYGLEVSDEIASQMNSILSIIHVSNAKAPNG